MANHRLSSLDCRSVGGVGGLCWAVSGLLMRWRQVSIPANRNLALTSSTSPNPLFFTFLRPFISTPTSANTSCIRSDFTYYYYSLSMYRCCGMLYTGDSVVEHWRSSHGLILYPTQTATPATPATYTAVVRCAICPREFWTQQSLDQHSAAVHPAGRWNPGAPVAPTFPCPTCRTIFPRQDLLESHCSVVHPVQSRFPCPNCTAVFFSPNSLSQHYTIAHPTYTRYPQRSQQLPCHLCSKTFDNHYALNQHLVSAAHLANPQLSRPAPVFTCEECGKQFSVKDLLTLHMAAHVQGRLRM